MPTSRQIVKAIIKFFEQPDGRAEHPPLPTAATSPPSGPSLAMLAIIADRWHCPRERHEDLRAWLWNLQVTLSEVELAAEEDLDAILQIEKRLQKLRSTADE